MPLPCGRETFVQSSKFVRFISLTANPRAASCQEGGIPARDHSCPGPTWHRHSPLPTGGKRAAGEEGGGTAPLRTSRNRPSRVLRRSRLHNPKGAGQNLSQTMLRHLTVGLTVGSVVILRYQTQPCIAGRASPFLPHATTAVHTALLFKLSSHTATPAGEGTRGRRFEGKTLFPAAASSQRCPSRYTRECPSGAVSRCNKNITQRS